MAPAVLIQNLQKHYGTLKLKDVLQVEPGKSLVYLVLTELVNLPYGSCVPCPHRMLDMWKYLASLLWITPEQRLGHVACGAF